MSRTSHLPVLTPEQRQEMLEKARIAREEYRERMLLQAHLLKNDFKDKPYWRKLASKHGVRMPPDYIPGSEARYLRRAMKRSGVSPDTVREAFGGDVKFLARTNPTWPAYALIGLILELADEQQTKSLTDLI